MGRFTDFIYQKMNLSLIGKGCLTILKVILSHLPCHVKRLVQKQITLRLSDQPFCNFSADRAVFP